MPAARDRIHRDSYWTWLPGFLRGELAPYPGRWGIVARMAVATTAVAVVCMTFRIPRAYQGAVYALLVSHEALQNNWRAALRIASGTVVTTIFILVTASIFAGSPPLHFLWNVASLFLAFFCISAMREYAAAVPVSVVIGVAIASWDRPLPAGANVADTLWLCLACVVGVLVTATVSYIFAAFDRRDVLVQPLVDRLSLVKAVLQCHASGRAATAETARQLDDAVLAGTSAWRLTLRRSGAAGPCRDRLSTTGALIGRLIDIAANLPRSAPEGLDKEQAGRLADAVAQFQAGLRGEREFVPIDLASLEAGPDPVKQIARTLELMSHAWDQAVKQPVDLMDSPAAEYLVFVPDAFTNTEHLKFALRGCLAATLCYVFYSLVAWQGLNSSIASCMFTAVSTVGASTQKLAVRFAGAILGGVILGMGTQIFVFPRVDSIFAFTLVFGAVSTLAAWFMTCSPRLSYLGLQIALAFDLVHLQSFRMETSLVAARDRIAGVFLGLAAMWLIFDHLWSSTAGVLMKRSLVRSLRLLAESARGPASTDAREAMRQSLALRETTSTALDQVQSFSDGILFEFGPDREASLEFREEVRTLLPQLRSLFVMSVSAIDYRLRLPGFELPGEAFNAQQRFDEYSADILEELAEEIDTGALRQVSALVSLAVTRPEEVDPSHTALLGRMDRLIRSLAKQVEDGVVGSAARVS